MRWRRAVVFAAIADSETYLPSRISNFCASEIERLIWLLSSALWLKCRLVLLLILDLKITSERAIEVCKKKAMHCICIMYCLFILVLTLPACMAATNLTLEQRVDKLEKDYVSKIFLIIQL